MNRLLVEPYSFLLYEEGGELLLDVEVGSVAAYTVTLPLTEAERAAWSTDGEAPIRALAAAVQADPKAFADRERR